MKQGQSKKVAVIISYCTMAVQFAVVFFLTPFLLKQLGKTEYGLFQLVSSTASYLSLLGFGFSASYIRFFSNFKAKENNAGIAILNGMFMTVFIIMSFVCLALGIVLCSNIDLVFGNAVSNEQNRSAYLMIILLSLNMALTFPKSIFICNTMAHEKFVFQKGVVLCIDIISPLLQVLFVFVFKSSVAISYAILLATITDVIVNIIYNIGFLKMQFTFRHFDWFLMREVVGFTFFIFLNQVLDLLSGTNIDNYLIGRICGTDSVTVYSMGGKISQMFHSVASPISAIFIPTIYRIVEGGNDRKKLSEVFTKVGKLQFIILYLFLTGFILWGKPFLTVWIGEGYDESYYIAIILMLSLTVALSQSIGIEIQRAVNKHRVRSVVYLVIDIANVIISIPLIMCFGSIGAALGTAMAMLLGTVFFMNSYYQLAIGVTIKYYWMNLIKTMAYTSPSIAIALLSMKLIVNQSLITYIFQIILYTICYLVTVYFLVLNREERRQFSIKNRREYNYK